MCVCLYTQHTLCGYRITDCVMYTVYMTEGVNVGTSSNDGLENLGVRGG